MSILFIQKNNGFILELGILLSVLKENGVTVHILFEEIEKEALHSKIKKIRPLLIGVYGDYNELYKQENFYSYMDIFSKIKKNFNEIPLFVGGIHSTVNLDLLKQYEFIDVAFVGDMENSILMLIKSIKDKTPIDNVEGVIFRNGDRIISNKNVVRTNLAKLPLPDIDSFLVDSGAFRYGHRINPGRDCPNSCAFCINHVIKHNTDIGSKGLPRYYPVDYLIAVVKLYYEKDPTCNVIYFTYSNFTYDKKFFFELSEKFRDEIYKKYGITYLCATRIERVDEEIAEMLKESGCSKVTVGLETGNERLRIDVLKKHLTNQQIVDGMKALKKYNLRVGAGLMFGIPDETIDNAFETLDFCRKVGIDFFSIGFFSPVPGLDLTKYAIEKGYLDKSYSHTDYSIFNVNINIENKKQILNLLKLWPLYNLFPQRLLFKILINLPLTRLYHIVYCMPRIKGVLKYDIRRENMHEKIRYLSYSLFTAFKGERPYTFDPQKNRR